MAGPHARTFQVILTGARLTPVSDADLARALRGRFRLSDDQAAAMLKGRCIVKRGIDAAAAEKFVGALREIGLDAVQESMAPTTSQAAAASAATAALSALQALAAQRLPRPRTSLAYRFALMLVTLMCVAVPAFYLAFTGAVAFAWLWYLTHIHHHLPRNIYAIAFAYAVPGVAGAALLLFLVRPLFAWRSSAEESLELDPAREPGFVAGVHALCRAIGVSPPIEIRLTCDANASVHFRSRWLSLVSGHKVLTIGMSLVGGLSARQFVGVLAHEFGHFAQRGGMICSFIVNSVNAWLEQCAYGEDPWHRRLHAWAEQAAEHDNWYSLLVNISVAAASLSIRGTRLLMAGLFHLSFRLSRHMSRQMEFDADRYEALLAGSDMFATTSRSLRALNHAFAEVNSANVDAWREQRLLRDLPEAATAHAREFDASRLAAIDEEISEQVTTRFWDSHPPDIDRVEHAQKLGCPGIYLVATPAAALFRDFAGLSQRATRAFYDQHGVQHTIDHLRPREEIMGHVNVRKRQREQLDRYFNGQLRFWPLLRLEAPEGVSVEQLGWQESIDRIRSRSPEIVRQWDAANKAQESRALLRAAVALGATSSQLGLPGADRTPAELARELEAIAAASLACHRVLDQMFPFYALRIQHAIASIVPPDEQRQAQQLRDMLAKFGALDREAAALDELAGAMSVLGSIADEHGGMPPAFEQLEASFTNSALQFLTLADRIPQTLTQDRTVGGYLRSRCPDLATGAISTPSARALWRLPVAFQDFYVLALGELVSRCEAAEQAAGVRPIRLVARETRAVA